MSRIRQCNAEIISKTDGTYTTSNKKEKKEKQVKDTAKEKLWGFKLAETLAIDRSNSRSYMHHLLS